MSSTDGNFNGGVPANNQAQGAPQSTSLGSIAIVQVTARHAYHCYQCNDMFSTTQRTAVCPTCNLEFISSLGLEPSFLVRTAPVPANAGDYYFGPHLDRIAEELSREDTYADGAPPASKSAVEALLNVEITKALMESENTSHCAVCQERYGLGEITKKMPCGHVYHPDCILPWLELHNSCPVCRYELPTDDPNYERLKTGRQESGDVSEGHDGTGNSAPSTSDQGESGTGMIHSLWIRITEGLRQLLISASSER